MRCELLFLLNFLFWIYQTSTDNTFSVHTTCSATPHDCEIRINCTICGFSGADLFNFEVEWYLQKHLNITSPANKTTPGKQRGNNTKYMWDFIPLTSGGDCEGNKTVFKLVDKNSTALSLGIYTCFVTLYGNSTKHSSIDLSSGEENISSNYVLIRVTNVPVGEISESCRKYGYNVLMNESVAKSVPLLEKESVYFPVCPSIQINNRSIAVCKPWISRVGCYNLTKDRIDNSVEMNCRSINIANWNKSLQLIGNTIGGPCYLLDGDVKDPNLKVSDAYCSKMGLDFSMKDNRTVFLNLFSILDINPQRLEETNSKCVAAYRDMESSRLFQISCDDHCDAYCSQYDGSKVSFQGFKDWKVARKFCQSLNSSLPNEEFTLNNRQQFNRSSLVCLDVFKSSFVLFRPVIKLARKENGTIIINAPIDYSEKLPYLCGTKIDTGKSNLRDCNMMTSDFNESNTRDTTTEILQFHTNMQPKPDISENSRLTIIIASSIFGLLLIVSIFACLITRILKRNQGNKSSTTDVLLDLYSEPIPGPEESQMKTKDHINAEEESAYSVADTKDNEYSQPLVNRDNNRPGPAKAVTSTDSEYADTDLGEYDVLRSQRTKRTENASLHCEFYDRTNNVVTGIYDVTSNRQNAYEYSMAEND